MNHLSRPVRPLIALFAAVIGALVLAGCGSTSGSGQSAYYTPAAYYQTIGGVNDCYYAADPSEVASLISAGLCPARSVAVLMPVTWEEEYYAYYSSPAYYNTYMPVRYRSHYTSVTIVRFKSTYSRQITTAESKAVYKSSTGGKVTGTSKLKFGSGSKSGTAVHGGGSGTVRSCSLSMTTLQDKSGSSSSHGGGSGSKSGSGTTSKSKTGSGSKGGC